MADKLGRETCPTCSKPIVTDFATWMYESNEELEDLCYCRAAPREEGTPAPLSREAPERPVFTGDAAFLMRVADNQEMQGRAPNLSIPSRETFAQNAERLRTLAVNLCASRSVGGLSALDEAAHSHMTSEHDADLAYYEEHVRGARRDSLNESEWCALDAEIVRIQEVRQIVQALAGHSRDEMTPEVRAAYEEYGRQHGAWKRGEGNYPSSAGIMAAINARDTGRQSAPREDEPEEIARIRFAAETCETAGRDENGPTPEWFRAGFLAEEVAPRLRAYADLLAAAPRGDEEIRDG